MKHTGLACLLACLPIQVNAAPGWYFSVKRNNKPKAFYRSRIEDGQDHTKVTSEAIDVLSVPVLSNGEIYGEFTGVAVDPDGNLIVNSRSQKAIVKCSFDVSNSDKSQVIKNCQAVAGAVGEGVCSTTRFKDPFGFGYRNNNGQNQFLVTDIGCGSVSLCTEGSAACLRKDGFGNPYGAAFSQQGVWVGERSSSKRLLKCTEDLSSCEQTAIIPDGIAGLAVDGEGSIYATSGTSGLYRCTATGTDCVKLLDTAAHGVQGAGVPFVSSRKEVLIPSGSASKVHECREVSGAWQCVEICSGISQPWAAIRLKDDGHMDILDPNACRGTRLNGPCATATTCGESYYVELGQGIQCGEHSLQCLATGPLCDPASVTGGEAWTGCNNGFQWICNNWCAANGQDYGRAGDQQVSGLEACLQLCHDTDGCKCAEVKNKGYSNGEVHCYMFQGPSSGDNSVFEACNTGETTPTEIENLADGEMVSYSKCTV